MLYNVAFKGAEIITLMMFSEQGGPKKGAILLHFMYIQCFRSLTYRRCFLKFVLDIQI